MDRVERENWIKIAARLDQSDSAETWFCARAKNIIYTHSNQINTNSIMFANNLRYLEFCAYTIS